MGRRRVAATAVALLTLVGACSSTPEVDVSSENDEAAAASSTPAAEESSAPESDDEQDSIATSTGDSADASTETAELGEPVATRKASVNGYQMRVDMYPVERRGSLADLNFTLTMVKAEDPDDELQVSNLLSDGNYDSVDSTGFAIDGVRLLDGANSKVHLAASDGNGACLCTRDLSGTFLEAGDSIVLSATYAAPPEDVEAVSVQVPKFGTFTDVPVQ
jgi:hypothetical protein